MLLLLPLLLSWQKSAPLFSQIFPQPTGQNGYEEYVRAADLVSGQNFEPLDPLSFGSNYLAARQRQAKEFQAAITLVQQGNQKPVRDPRAADPRSDRWPEMPAFRRLGSLLLSKAYADFASGDSRAGTRALLDGLLLAANIQGGPGVANLSAIMILTKELPTFRDRLPSLSRADCQEVEAVVSRILSMPDPLARSLQLYWDAKVASLNDFFDKPTLTGNVLDRKVDELIQKIIDAPASEREAWRKRCIALVGEYFRGLIAASAQPEPTWKEALANYDIDRLATQEADPVLAGLLRLTMPSQPPGFRQAAAMRTQLRILLLHARVIDYRWTTGALPSRLSDAAPEGERQDSLSGGAFVYERNEGGYRLYSTGSSTTGVVELGSPLPVAPRGPGEPPH